VSGAVHGWVSRLCQDIKEATVHLIGQAHNAAKSRQIQLGAIDITPPLNSGLRVCLSMHRVYDGRDLFARLPT